MKVIPLAPTALRVGAKVPFALRDGSGALLLAAGGLIESELMRKQLVERGLFVDILDSENFQRALAGKVDSMVRNNDALRTLANVRVEAAELVAEGHNTGLPGAMAPVRKVLDPLTAWQNLALRAGGLLHEPSPQDYVGRLALLDQDIVSLLRADPDSALLLMMQNATSEVHQYSVNHALLVCIVCELAASELTGWPTELHKPLRCAALTMNIAMTSLQDELARQTIPMSQRQRGRVHSHAQDGAEQLATLGVEDALWIEAVAHHHTAPFGPLEGLATGLRLARLIQRADIFAARLSPRRLRPAMSATSAARATYLDENQAPDEAGAAILKALGIYPPGCYVQLASGELGVVLKRGARANEPRVASVISRSGTPLGDPIIRDTRLKAHEIKGGVAPKDVRVRVPVAKLLSMVN